MTYHAQQTGRFSRRRGLLLVEMIVLLALFALIEMTMLWAFRMNMDVHRRIGDSASPVSGRATSSAARKTAVPKSVPSAVVTAGSARMVGCSDGLYEPSAFWIKGWNCSMRGDLTRTGAIIPGAKTSSSASYARKRSVRKRARAARRVRSI